MKLVNVGFGNMVNAQRLVGVFLPDSAPIKRIVQTAKEQGRLLDVTQGRKTASVLLTDSEHIFLSYLKPEKIAQRVAFEQDAEEGEEEI